MVMGIAYIVPEEVIIQASVTWMIKEVTERGWSLVLGC
jgi:hypothetical protein